MSARSKARKRALDVLFEADLRGRDPVETLAEWTARADPPVPDYASELVTGVAAHRDEIDAMLAGLSPQWPLDRMPSVDRTVLRIASYELWWRADVPAAVAIDEAVELAKSLSTEDSPAFVNGVLAKVLAARPAAMTESMPTAEPAPANEQATTEPTS